MTDDTTPTTTGDSLPPASPAEGQSPAGELPVQSNQLPAQRVIELPAQGSALAPTSLLDNPALLYAATGKRFTKNQFKAGNPYRYTTVFTPEVLAKALSCIRNHFTMSGAAAVAGVGFRTLCRWQRENPEIAELIAMARSTRLEEMLAQLMEFTASAKVEKSNGAGKADTRDSRDWRGIAWLIERLPWAHRELYKRDPNAITPDVLAAKIGEIVARLIPLIDAGKHAQAQVILDEICGSLKPKDGEGDDDGR